MVYPPEWVKLRLWRASVGKDVEPSELSYIPVGNVKWFNHFEKQFGCFFIKLNIHPPITSSITPRYLPKRTEIICPHKDLQMNVHSSFIHKYLSTSE